MLFRSTTKIPRDRVERITSNEFKSAVKESSQPPRQRYDAALEERKRNSGRKSTSGASA